MTAWAEVIGDPIAHSRSPAIHGFWLNALGIEGTYRATLMPSDGLAGFFAARRRDLDWRGCNVTAPHKLAVIPFLDRLSDSAERTGAVNCITRDGDGLIGGNSDVDGIAEALTDADVSGCKAVLIGAGGAARAALAWLADAGAGEILCLARDPEKARSALAFDTVSAFGGEAIEGANLVVNASPLGMAHADPMPPSLLAGLGNAAPGATAFDMIYQPLDTPFLQAARAAGLNAVDGLSMLIGQARRAFESFFGAEPPRSHDDDLRRMLTG